MKTRLRLWEGESGQSMVLFACCFAVLCMFAAVAVDVGRGYAVKADAQHAADAAALAAAGRIPDGYSGVYGAAKTYLQDNGIDTADASNFTVRFPYEGDAAEVQVTCSEHVDDTFARVAGSSGATVSASAVAQRVPGAVPYAYGLLGDSITIGPGASASIHGNIHSNGKIAFGPGGQAVYGDVEAAGRIDAGGGLTAGGVTAGGVTAGGRYRPAADIGTDVGPFDQLVAREKADAVRDTAGVLGGSRIFASNRYFPRGVSAEEDSALTLSGGAVLSDGDLDLRNVNSTDDAAIGTVAVYCGGNLTLRCDGAGKTATIYGNLYCPHGTLRIESPLTVYGSIVARNILLTGSGGCVTVLNDASLWPAGSGSSPHTELVR